MIMRRILLLSVVASALMVTATEPVRQESRYLWPDDFMADPAAHLFDGKVYIYTSHDWASPVTDGTDGAHFDMRDYHAFSIDGDPMTGRVTDHGTVLSIDSVPWVWKQMWATDVAEKDGRYYLYFSAKDKNGLFRLGVAEADSPAGPFKADPAPIHGSYSIDPAVLSDDGEYYIYFGGLQGGQNQRYDLDNIIRECGTLPAKTDMAVPPRVARLSSDMRQFAESPRPVIITDSLGNQLTEGDSRRFFEAPWVNKIGDKYYLTYSTGNFHTLCYATGDSPYGPFVYGGEILTPVTGWTTHQSLVEYDGKWYLVFHDSRPSGGVSSLRSMKVTPLTIMPDGNIVTIDGEKQSKK